MSKYLFDLIDWGADKDLEKCYRFDVSTIVERVTEPIEGDRLAPPFDSFWVESNLSKFGKPQESVAAFCKFENHDWSEDDGEQETSGELNIYTFTNYKRSGIAFLGFNHWVLLCPNHTIYMSNRKEVGSDILGLIPECIGGACVDAWLADDEHRILLDRTAAQMAIIFLMHLPDRQMAQKTPNRQQVRKSQRSGNLPPHEYYELTIGPRGANYSTNGGGKSQGLNRYHSVMGNWAYYSPDAPLLGHTSGYVATCAYERQQEARNHR